jgi:putative aminopeptidase FrvX
MIDQEFLKALTETPSVGTACGPCISLLTPRFGNGYAKTLVPDGFCLFQKAGAALSDLKVVFVAHMDEVGGCIYGARPHRQSGGYNARFWGNTPDVFANARLQAFDYLAEEDDTFPVQGEVITVGDEQRLVMHGEGIRPYRTVWTFQEETTFTGDIIDGKALDPRVTLYAVVEAVRALDSPHVGAMLVMAEECAMDVARKGVAFLQRHAPALQLIANADVPGINNIGDGQLDLPAIRVFEGRNFIDPSFGIRVTDILQAQGVSLHLSAARSGSQTLLFTPLAPTLSIALPSDGVHLPRVKMSLRGTERCTTLLYAIGENALNGKLPI